MFNIETNNAYSCRSVQGIIKRHKFFESGFWFFRKKRVSVYIRIDKKQLNDLNENISKEIILGKLFTGIPPVIRFIVREEEAEEYIIGSKVDITFGYVCGFEPYMSGIEPLIITRIQLTQASN